MIKVDVTVHVHNMDAEAARRIEVKVGQAVLMMRKVLESVVSDPAKVEELVRQVESDAARLGNAVKAVSSK